jgi:hypothetical protein
MGSSSFGSAETMSVIDASAAALRWSPCFCSSGHVHDGHDRMR